MRKMTEQETVRAAMGEVWEKIKSGEMDTNGWAREVLRAGSTALRGVKPYPKQWFLDDAFLACGRGLSRGVLSNTFESMITNSPTRLTNKRITDEHVNRHKLDVFWQVGHHRDAAIRLHRKDDRRPNRYDDTAPKPVAALRHRPRKVA